MFPTEPIAILEKRSRLLNDIRQFFEAMDFIEVQTPVLSRDTMVDQAIDPIAVNLSGEQKPFYLQTSPEFAMKRLLLQGCQRIYQIGPVFRHGDVGPLHNPEFTMLEWYRVGDDYAAGIELLTRFAKHFFADRPVKIVTCREILEHRFSINPHSADAAKMRRACAEAGLDIPGGCVTVDDLFQLMMAEVEKDLGQDSICIVKDWPIHQSALAKTSTSNQSDPIAERFELYVDGIELANGYHELTDPAEQLTRLERNNRIRASNGLPPLPVNSQLLKEMQQQQMPECAGVAVGIDRLLMVTLGLDRVAPVLTFPHATA